MLATSVAQWTIDGTAGSWCWYTRSQLADLLGWSPKQVKVAFAELGTRGVLERRTETGRGVRIVRPGTLLGPSTGPNLDPPGDQANPDSVPLRDQVTVNSAPVEYRVQNDSVHPGDHARSLHGTEFSQLGPSTGPPLRIPYSESPTNPREREKPSATALQKLNRGAPDSLSPGGKFPRSEEPGPEPQESRHPIGFSASAGNASKRGNNGNGAPGGAEPEALAGNLVAEFNRRAEARGLARRERVRPELLTAIRESTATPAEMVAAVAGVFADDGWFLSNAKPLRYAIGSRVEEYTALGFEVLAKEQRQREEAIASAEAQRNYASNMAATLEHRPVLARPGAHRWEPHVRGCRCVELGETKERKHTLDERGRCSSARDWHGFRCSLCGLESKNPIAEKGELRECTVPAEAGREQEVRL